MNISKFIIEFIYMIDGPLVVNKQQGFHLKNGMRILFGDTKLTKDATLVLQRHYKKGRQS